MSEDLEIVFAALGVLVALAGLGVWYGWQSDCKGGSHS